MTILGNAMAMLLSLALPVAYAYTDAERADMFKVGLSNVMRETINAPVTLEKGTIPDWLSGM
jgi:hypothetical protein